MRTPELRTKALATIATGKLGPVLDVSLPPMLAFAERHGYDVVIGTGDASGRPPAWSKVLLLRSLVERYERVLWVDADALILDVEADLPPLPDGHVHALVAHHVEGEEVPNTGFWLLRGGDLGARFLDEVWARDQWAEHPWWEQAAVLDAMGYVNVARDTNVLTPDTPCRPGRPSEWRERTTYLADEWNVLYHHLDFIEVTPKVLHYAYMPTRDRVEKMTLELLSARINAPGTGFMAKAALRGSRWSRTNDVPLRLRRVHPKNVAKIALRRGGGAWRALCSARRRR